MPAEVGWVGLWIIFLFASLSPSFSGAHIIQHFIGCEWDDETEKSNGFNILGYNGEDFIAFDIDTKKWIVSTPQAETAKQFLDENKDRNNVYKTFLTMTCPATLKLYFNYAKTFMHRKGIYILLFFAEIFFFLFYNIS